MPSYQIVNCPKCEWQNLAGTPFCLSCQEPLAEQVSLPNKSSNFSRQERAKAPNNQTNQTVFCPACESPNLPLATLCRDCRVPLPRRRIEIEPATSPIYDFLVSTQRPEMFIKTFAGIFLVLIAFTVFIYQTSAPHSQYNEIVGNSSGSSTEKVKLPADAWYNFSVWSYLYNNPSASQIIQKHEAVCQVNYFPEKIKTLTMSGKIYINRIIPKSKYETNYDFVNQPADIFIGSGTIEMKMKEPGKIFTKLILENGEKNFEINQGVTKSEAWRQTIFKQNEIIVDKKIENIQSAELDEFRLDKATNSIFDSIRDAKYKTVEWVDKHPYYILYQPQENGSINILTFDAVTGFLRKTDNKGILTTLGDYRPVKTIKLPHDFLYEIVGAKGERFSISVKVNQWTENDSVDEMVFLKPFDL